MQSGTKAIEYLNWKTCFNTKFDNIFLKIESHPYLNNTKLINFCKEHDVVAVAYSPLGSPDRPWAKPEDPVIFEDAKIKELAKKYNKSPVQVILRYQVCGNLNSAM